MGKIKRVGQTLLQFRTERNWTQSQLAEFLSKERGAHVTQAQVSFWENNRAMKASTQAFLERAIASAPPAETQNKAS